MWCGFDPIIHESVFQLSSIVINACLLFLVPFIPNFEHVLSVLSSLLLVRPMLCANTCLIRLMVHAAIVDPSGDLVAAVESDGGLSEYLSRTVGAEIEQVMERMPRWTLRFPRVLRVHLS